MSKNKGVLDLTHKLYLQLNYEEAFFLNKGEAENGNTETQVLDECFMPLFLV